MSSVATPVGRHFSGPLHFGLQNSLPTTTLLNREGGALHVVDPYHLHALLLGIVISHYLFCSISHFIFSPPCLLSHPHDIPCDSWHSEGACVLPSAFFFYMAVCPIMQLACFFFYFPCRPALPAWLDRDFLFILGRCGSWLVYPTLLPSFGSGNVASLLNGSGHLCVWPSFHFSTILLIQPYGEWVGFLAAVAFLSYHLSLPPHSLFLLHIHFYKTCCVHLTLFQRTAGMVTYPPLWSVWWWWWVPLSLPTHLPLPTAFFSHRLHSLPTSLSQAERTFVIPCRPSSRVLWTCLFLPRGVPSCLCLLT